MAARKKSEKKWVCLLIAMLFVIIGVTVFFWASAPLETKTFDAKFIVGQNVGFDLNKTALTFGKIIPGGSAVRAIKIENRHNFSLEARIYASSKIVDYISFDEKDLLIMPYENKSLPITINIPLNISFGEYAGKIVFKIYKAENKK